MSDQWVDFEAVKAAVTAQTVIAHYGIDWLKERGDELRGRCPIHQGDGDRSFHINSTKKAFYCFSCQAKGNLIDFVAAMEKCSFRDAALRLQDWLGIAGQAPRPMQPAQTTGPKLAREKRTEGGGETLVNKPLAFELRGIDPAHAYLTDRGITRETAEHFGIGYFPGKGSMQGRVVIPIHNEAGELVAYAGRSIDDSEPKYKLPAGFHKAVELYNLHRSASAGADRGLIVVEGFFDAMRVHQAGYPFVVALMGCTMSAQQEALIVAHAGQVVLMLDGDEAGQRGMQDISWRLARHIWTRAVVLPDGLQPDQLTAEELAQVLGEK